MKHALLRLALLLLAGGCACRGQGGAIIDGPGYAFALAAPKGWKLVSTKELPAACFPAGTTIAKTPILLYVRCAAKSELHVESIEELNQLDLKGVQQSHPAALSTPAGTVKNSEGAELPVFQFSGGGYSELVAYSDEGKSIVAFVATADQPEQLKGARPAFDEMVGSYLFLTDSPNLPKAIPKPKSRRQR